MESVMPIRTPFVSVVLDQNLTKPLDYAVPAALQETLQVGMRVEVPFRATLKNATIVELKQTSLIPNLKSITRLFDDAPSPVLWKLAQWMSAYYAAPLQKTLRCFNPPSVQKKTAPKKEFLFFLELSKDKTADWIRENRNEKAAIILEQLLASPKGQTAAHLIEQGHVSRSTLDTLLKRKWIRKEEKNTFDLAEEEFFPSTPKTLNGEQAECLAKINASLESGKFATHLIQGVTGSGKTEVYLQAIQQTLLLGKSAIFLVPEIALTSQTIERFRARFQEKIAIWHHKRSFGEKNVAWEGLKQGKTKVVIGARSAIFCPAQNVGLIIVDEEHDASYKQSEEAPCYHGRDVAVMRGFLEGATVILGSATPALESRYNADIGKYTLSTLRTRPKGISMPHVQIVDMKREFDKAGGFTHFSSPLLDGIKKRCELGEQTLIFLNKRGYTRNHVCASCRNSLKCTHCDLNLTYHKTSHHLQCHLCDYAEEVPRQCPTCGSQETMQTKGFGTEHVERSLHAIIPGIRTLRMDKDTTQKKHDAEDLYLQFKAHKADVLIGTQMIAKGFHFPAVTLVGILAADAALNIPDFRSCETVLQLILQVAGRAGRSELPGEVIVQTFLPDHPLMRCAANLDFDAFYAQEVEERKLFGYPPFCRMVKITSFGKKEDETRAACVSLYSQIERLKDPAVELFAVKESAYAKVKDLYRFQFVLKTPSIHLVQKILNSLSSKVRFKIDVDPINTLF